MYDDSTLTHGYKLGSFLLYSRKVIRRSLHHAVHQMHAETEEQADEIWASREGGGTGSKNR